MLTLRTDGDKLLLGVDLDPVNHPGKITEFTLVEYDRPNNAFNLMPNAPGFNWTQLGGSLAGGGGIKLTLDRTYVQKPQLAVDGNGDVPFHDNSSALGAPKTLAATS